MSLINEMLKDLQQQKEGNAKQQKTQLKPRMIDRVPYLPLPVVLAGGGVLLLVFIWWIAGALSDAMFEYEPAKQAAPQVEMAQEIQAEEPVKSVVTETAEVETLTDEERDAEPPADVAAVEPAETRGIVVAVAAPEKPVTVKPIKKDEPIKKVAPRVDKKPAVVAKQPDVKAAAVPRKVKVAKTVTTKAPVQRVPVKKPAPAVSSTPKRLHPDQLPGAVLTPVQKAPITAPLDPRPSKAPANTPYGMADEAYLDGKWALSQQRSNLAIQSLQHALELYPGHLPARELLVDLFNKKGKSGEAMFLLAEGLEIAPDYMAFKKGYVKLLTEQGDYETAIKVMLKGGLPDVDKDPEAHVLLASLYQKLGESFLAAQTYRNLLVSWPQTGAFWVGLGSALEKQKLSEEAVVCYQKALETRNLRDDLSAFARKRLRLLN